MFGPLRKRIEDAVAKLEQQIASSGTDGAAAEEEMKKAKETLEQGKEASKAAINGA
jgi:hypothetical protein